MRLLLGLMFACHGAQKRFSGWFAKPGQAPQPPDMFDDSGWRMDQGFICGLLIAIRLLTLGPRHVPRQRHDVSRLRYGVSTPKGGVLSPSSIMGNPRSLYCWVFLFIFLFTARAESSVDGLMKRGGATSVAAT